MGQGVGQETEVRDKSVHSCTEHASLTTLNEDDSYMCIYILYIAISTKLLHMKYT